MNTSPVSHALGACPSCQGAYDSKSARVLERKGPRSFLHISCPYCLQAMILSVESKREGLTCAGIITDWTFQDAKRFLHSKPISLDEVIQAHDDLDLDSKPGM